ncbi:hypothetical protein [Paraburkholderia sp. C35]|uniref:hypothetical protein n=1 Tax=Paraburkholderia sp. C35 TaxID=2126993 RepID=UPI000D68FA60|nr:hypothetical protein [Paraburkholderia sp. C35]
MSTTTFAPINAPKPATILGPTSVDEVRALRALGRDVLKTPLHWIALNVALDAYQSMVIDRREIVIRTTRERIAIGDLMLSEKPEHTQPRADLIAVHAARLGMPVELLTLVVTRVLSVKDARSDATRERYNAVMRMRALDDVQFVYVHNDDGGHGAVDVYSRKARIAEANAAHAARAVRKTETAGFSARLLGMFNR